MVCRTLGWVYDFCCWLAFCVLMVRLVGFVCVWLDGVVLFGVCILLVGFDAGMFRVVGLVVICWVGSILGFVMCYYEVVGWLVLLWFVMLFI